MAILAIVSGMVTLSLVGLTSLAKQRALDGERMQVQAALEAMMMDQGIDPGDACPGGVAATTDMDAFPTSAPYGGSHSGQPVALHPHYLHGAQTQRAYECTPNGSVQPASG